MSVDSNSVYSVSGFFCSHYVCERLTFIVWSCKLLTFMAVGYSMME